MRELLITDSWPSIYRRMCQKSRLQRTTHPRLRSSARAAWHPDLDRHPGVDRWFRPRSQDAGLRSLLAMRYVVAFNLWAGYFRSISSVNGGRYLEHAKRSDLLLRDFLLNDWGIWDGRSKPFKCPLHTQSNRKLRPGEVLEDVKVKSPGRGAYLPANLWRDFALYCDDWSASSSLFLLLSSEQPPSIPLLFYILLFDQTFLVKVSISNVGLKIFPHLLIIRTYIL